MIKIKISKNKIEIKGHTEGRICAAISCLSQTFINSLIKADEEIINFSYPSDSEDKSGITSISFPTGYIKTIRTWHYYEFFKNGIILLKDTYPNEIEIENE